MKIKFISENTQIYNGYVTNNSRMEMETNSKQAKVEEVSDPTTAQKPLFFIMEYLGQRHNASKAVWKKLLQSILLIAFFFIYGTTLIIYRCKTSYIYIPIITSLIDAYSNIHLFILITCQVISSTFSSPVTENIIKYQFRAVDSLLGIDQSALYKKGRRTVKKLIALFIFMLIFITSLENYSKCSIRFFISYSFEFCMYFMKCFITLYFITHLYFIKNQLFMLNVQLGVVFDQAIDNESINITKGNTRINDISWAENYFFSCDELRKQSKNALKYNKVIDIDNLAKVYLHCCNQTKLINFQCSTENLLEVIYGLISMIRCSVFAVFYALNTTPENKNTVNVLANVIYTLHDMAILFMMLSCCEFVKAEAKKTAVHLDNILHNYYSVISEERHKVEAWAELTMRRFPQFTVCGSLDLNYGLFVNLLGTVVAYIVIVTQLE